METTQAIQTHVQSTVAPTPTPEQSTVAPTPTARRGRKSKDSSIDTQVPMQNTEAPARRGRKPKAPPILTQVPVQSTVASALAPVARPSAFNLAELRLPQNFGDAMGVKKLILRVPVRKPIKTDFFRASLDETWRIEMMLLELKEEGETYVLTPHMWDVIPELAKPVMLQACIDRQNNVFLVPVPLPGPDGRRNPWHQSLSEAVTLAQNKWVRIAANMKVGGYDVLMAVANLPEPEWPDRPFSEIIEIAFRDRLIDTPEHPVIRQLLGVA